MQRTSVLHIVSLTKKYFRFSSCAIYALAEEERIESRFVGIGD
jgi:hypothetical protein